MLLKRKNWLITTLLLAFCVAIFFFSNDSNRVENKYSLSFYQYFSPFLRALFGWLPFSIGDVLYALLIIYLGYKLVAFVTFLFQKKWKLITKEKGLNSIFSFINGFCIVYIIFYTFWGINYNRKGIAYELKLNIDKYSLVDLKNVNALLVEKVNDCKTALLDSNSPYYSEKILFKKVENAYNSAEKKYPFLHYKNASIKKSLWGWLGNYVGFEGYYNPFTGEAQVNTTVPAFTQPFTTCHEVAHQLGYAKEMEANFVGYLVATESKDNLFAYSTYAEMFLYANRTLYIADSSSAREYKKQLHPDAIADFKERQKFYAAHKSFVEPAISYLYGKFLEHNQQPLGMLSYDEVTAFLIAFYKKYGRV